MADFAYKPDFAYKVTPNYAVLISKFENNYEQRRLKAASKLRRFELVFKVRQKAEMDAVKSFFESKKGALTAFTMDIEDEEVKGRFVEGSFWFSLYRYQIYNYGFTFQEVLA